MIRAVLFDRDGTLVADDPANRDPSAVSLMPGAREAVERARALGLRVGVVTNQPGLADGRITRAQLDAIDARIEELLGPFDGWFVCPHGAFERCTCRKPQPGLLLDALAAFGTCVRECAMIGDIGSDIDAARAIGMRAVLVPTHITLASEIAAAPLVASSLFEALDVALHEDVAA